MTDTDLTQEAVAAFWQIRKDQVGRLDDGGAAGGAARAAKHLDAIRDLVAQIFLSEGLPVECIVNEPYLPGFYRPRKRWDLLIKHRGVMVAAIEFKSQVGSVGKNLSNRFEEALGSATDTRVAQTENAAFGELPPWLGYVFVLREDEETEAKRGRLTAQYPIDPVWQGQSYNERYQTMIGRFIEKEVYHAGWFITTKVDDKGQVVYSEPLATASGNAFRAAVKGRVEYVKAVLGEKG